MIKASGMEILSSRGWLATTPAPFRAAVLPNCDLITVDRGQTFFAAGDDGGGIYGVVSGRLEVHVSSGLEDPTLAHFNDPGQWFGEIAAFGGGKRRVSIIASAHTELLRLSQANMQRITERDPEAWMHFAKLLAMNFSTAMAVVAALRFEQPLQRVAATLRNLVGSDRSHKPTITLSQSDLGALTVLSRYTVSLALAEMERQHVIQRRYGRIEIVDLNALRNMIWAPEN